MKSIFTHANPEIERIIAAAGEPRKVLCIPIDYAKQTHLALACNGEGAQYRAPFPIKNNPEGIDFLLEVVEGLCRKHHIRTEHVIFGGEDCASFSWNFTEALAVQGHLVIGVHAGAAARERGNQNASTDTLDLDGIASMLLNKKSGRTIRPGFGNARKLRILTHHRQSLVKARSSSMLRTHHLVDQLLPGFLDEKKSGLCPFARASLWLMSERFSPRQVRLRRRPALLRHFRSFGVRDPGTAVDKLYALCESVLPPPAALCESLQIALGRETLVFQALDEGIGRLERDIALGLAGTPGAMLTTVPGIGVTLASKFFAEFGDPERDRSLKQSTAYAGLAPRIKQTGGPDQEARTRGRARRCNTMAKNLIFDIALKMGQYGHPDLKADYQRREAMGQDVRRTMGRRMLRICFHIIRSGDFFMPPSMNNAGWSDRRAYFQKAWRPILIKWRNAGAILKAFAPGTPLEEWRLLINERYDLNLTKKSPQNDDVNEL